MARTLVLLWRRLGRHFAENKLNFFFSTCLLLLVTIALIQSFSYFLDGNLEDSNHELVQQMYLMSNRTTDDTFPFVVEATLSKKVKKFSNEEARIVGFPVNPKKFRYKQRSQKIIYLATKYFSEWNPRHYYYLHLGDKTFKRYPCPISECVVTNDPKDLTKADAVLFHVRDLIIHQFPTFRSEKQVWILYSMEPSWLELFDMKRLNGLFNWTMSYRYGSDIMIKYGFIGRRAVPLPEKTFHLSEKSFQKKENRAVWLVSNCCTEGKREKYVTELVKHFPVDVLGGCGKEGCRPAETQRCYMEIEKKYKFYMAFENAICQNYVTEKLYNALEYNIIPVVFGGADYNTLLPRNSFINALAFKGPKELANYLWLVSGNVTLYRSYFTWKETHRTYLQPWMCDLCEKLHSDIVDAPVRYDLVRWWYEEHSCKRWTENGLENASRSIMAVPCYHTYIFQ